MFAESSWGRYVLVVTTASMFLFDSSSGKVVWRMAPDA